MRNGRKILDMHMHVFDKIDGKSVGGKTVGLKDGKIRTGNIESQFMPANYHDTSFPVDACNRIMDSSGVDKALLIQNPTIGNKNDYISDSVKQYPDRFFGSVQVDMYDPDAAEQVATYAENPLVKVLKLEISEEYGWTGIYPKLQVCDSPEMQAIWEVVRDKDLRIVYDIGGVGHRAWQLDQFEKLSAKMKNTQVIIEHFGGMNMDLFGVPWAMNRFDELISLAKRDNIYLGLTAVSCMLADKKTGYDIAWEAVKRAASVIGYSKLIWGSDIPGTLRIYSYDELIEWIEKAPFISEAEKDLIFWKNGMAFFGENE
ncbi:MAG: amidohydrolase family protein [Christensenellales bacterium]